LVLVLTQELPHLVGVLPPQDRTQAPPTQISPEAQFLIQVPQ